MRARGPLRRVACGVLCAGAILRAAPALSAQDAASVTGDSASLATMAALTGSLILAGAGGAQLIGSPTAWSRTWPGFRSRVADQTGFYLVQLSTVQSLGRVMGYRPDATPCLRDALVGCAVTATFSAFDREGRRRVNVPLVASILVGTGASLLWRPERNDRGQAWAFVGTRVGITVGGFVAERIVVDWWAQRHRP